TRVDPPSDWSHYVTKGPSPRRLVSIDRSRHPKHRYVIVNNRWTVPARPFPISRDRRAQLAATTLSCCGRSDGDYSGSLRGAGDAADRAPPLRRDPGVDKTSGATVDDVRRRDRRAR